MEKRQALRVSLMVEMTYKVDGLAITMLRERTTRSHSVVAGGNAAMYSFVCRVRVVKTLQ